ncbi:hypothetical protein B0H13DRAFT_1865112 [Mycena leptocephala]|nr:hypothetical protein B0H13DRAFT_1865112 [Mycena leptocephala]
MQLGDRHHTTKNPPKRKPFNTTPDTERKKRIKLNESTSKYRTKTSDRILKILPTANERTQVDPALVFFFSPMQPVNMWPSFGPTILKKDVPSMDHCATPERIAGLLPDGRTERVFDYIGHTTSVLTSMASLRARGVKFAELEPGVSVGQLTYNDAHLLVVQRAHWESMSDAEQVALCNVAATWDILTPIRLGGADLSRVESSRHNRLEVDLSGSSRVPQQALSFRKWKRLGS